MSGYLEHYGTPRHSGRYPWGSGDNPYQHQNLRARYNKNKEFLDEYNALRKTMSGTELAEHFHVRSSTQLRAQASAASNWNRKLNIQEIEKLKDKGYSLAEISRRVSLPVSTVKSLMNPNTKERASASKDLEDFLKKEVESKKFIDVGIGVESLLNNGEGITKDRLDKVLENLKQEGYTVCDIKYEQLQHPGQHTTVRVLAPPGYSRKEVSKHRTEIQTITDNTHADKTVRAFGIEKPVSISGDRVYIRYPSDGGDAADGTILIRKGVDDLSLGKDSYAQVRIAVNDTHYLKGMALYGDDSDIPPGYDVVFNTSKPDGTPPEKVFKSLKETFKGSGEIDWDNPFGALIKTGETEDEMGQSHYVDPKTGETKLRAINKVNSEGDWDNWSVTLSSQFLSKQRGKLIKQQLDRTIDLAKAEYEEILKCPNSVVRNKLLNEFASDCDSSAVHLKATGFPRQAQKVILPLNSMNDGTNGKLPEIYAPTFEDGEELILVRHPHQGTFEIPHVRVNNRDAKGRKLLGNVRDAIGIPATVAYQLSGADFDGDTVTCIPIKGMEKDIKYDPAIPELRDFNPKQVYAKPDDAEPTGKETKGRKFNKGREMGMVSNLITDMTLLDAPLDDIILATKHALTVIDAEKHNLDWEQSEIDNDIKRLRKMYQGKASGGAHTLISRSKGVSYVDERSLIPRFNKETGEIDPILTNKVVVGKDGKEHVKQQKSSKMAEAHDAFELVSDPNSPRPQEVLYAQYANTRKQMAKDARLATLNTEYTKNEDAAKAFSRECASLRAKLNVALKNKTYEHVAQIKAWDEYLDRYRNLPEDMTSDEKRKEAGKIRQQALNGARKYYGASKEYIEPTAREWEAIMSHALPKSVVDDILKNMKSETIKELAMPHESSQVTPSMLSTIMNMQNAGYTLNDIANRLDISPSLVATKIKEETYGA